MISWKKFAEDPFGFIDTVKLRVGRFDFNVLSDDVGCRKVALWFGVAMLAMWVLFGFDSTPLQFVHVLYDGVPGLLAGQKGLGDLVQIYNQYYGKEMHYSAFVIYVFLFWALSRNWARVGVTKAKNVLFSFAGMFLAIGLFEWFWILSFGIFQSQPWVYTWEWPQLKILYQNFGLTLAGALGAFYMWVISYKFENKICQGRLWLFNCRAWKLWILIGLSVASALFWIYYPGHVQQFNVILESGQVWESSRLFPQTLYTVDLNPGDSVNAGVWFYFEDNWIHLVNTIVKFLWALTTYHFFRVKKGDL